MVGSAPVRQERINWRIAPPILAVCLLAAAPLAAVDFAYQSSAGEVIYRFTPTTGTLSDLTVLFEGREMRPAAGGGIRIFKLGGSTLDTLEGRHQVTLVSESQSGGEYRATFTWAHEFESFDIDVTLRREGPALVAEFVSAADRVRRFDLGRSLGMPQPRIVDLPYGHGVLFSGGVFASALLDARRSNASEIFPARRYVSSSSAEYGSTAYYHERTDGSRSTLRETVRITVSPDIEDTFYRPPNPVSSWRKRLEKYVIADLWREGSFRDYLEYLQFLVSEGVENVFAIVHIWQRYGYDNGLPSTVPASPQMGGEEGLKAIADLCRANGYLFGLHTNYVDFYPNSDLWQPADLALDSEGEPLETWFNPRTGIQSFLLKPSRALRYARLQEPEIHRRYRTSASFLDVHSAVLPSGMVDYDARVAGAGRQSGTFEHWRGLFAYARGTHKGPVAGEGKGFAAPVWAGYVDAIEADPRSLQQQVAGRGGSAVPTLVDYKLRVLHPLFVPHGAGYLNRFYPKKSRYRRRDLERYMATELAFGNAAFFDTRYFRPAYRPELLRKHRLMSPLQPRYLRGRVEEILYRVQGEDLPLSDALRKVLPGAKRQRVDAVLSEKLGIVQIRYAPNLTLWVNRSRKRTVDVVHQGVTYRLRRNDFLAHAGAQLLAFSAQVEGRDAEFVCSSCS